MTVALRRISRNRAAPAASQLPLPPGRLPQDRGHRHGHTITTAR